MSGDRLTVEKYRGDTLLFVRTVSVALKNDLISTATPLFREDRNYFHAGVTYECTIGLGVLSKVALAFDFRNMVLWPATGSYSARPN
jgi:hypothetical protein